MADEGFIDRIGFDVLLDLLMGFVFHKLFVKKGKGGEESEKKDQGTAWTKDDEAALLDELRQIVADYKTGALAARRSIKEEQAFVLRAWNDFTAYCLNDKKRPEILVAIRKILKADDDPEGRRQTFGFLFELLVTKGRRSNPADRFDPVISLIDSVNVSELAQAELNVKEWFQRNRGHLEAGFRRFVNPAWLKKQLPKWRRFKAQLEQRANRLGNERRTLHRQDRTKTRNERINELAGAAGDLILGRPTKWRFSLFNAIITIIAIAVVAMVVISMIN